MKDRGLRLVLPEIPRLHFDLIDVPVGVIDVAGAQTSRREFAWIGTLAAVPHLIAAAVR